MLILTKKTRKDWFRAFAQSGFPASVAPFAIKTHLGRYRRTQSQYLEMEKAEPEKTRPRTEKADQDRSTR